MHKRYYHSLQKSIQMLNKMKSRFLREKSKSLILLVACLFNITLLAQDKETETKLFKKVADLTCDCMENSKATTEEALTKDFEHCLISQFKANYLEFEDLYGQENLTKKKGEEIGMKVSLEVLKSCTYFTQKITSSQFDSSTEEGKASQPTDDEPPVPNYNLTQGDLLDQITDRACNCASKMDLEQVAFDEMPCFDEESNFIEAYAKTYGIDISDDNKLEFLENKIGVHILTNCPIMYEILLRDGLEEFGIKRKQIGKLWTPSDNVERDIVKAACPCLEKLDINASIAQLEQKLEQCLMIGLFKNIKGVVKQYGSSFFRDDDNKAMDSFSQKLLQKVAEDCPAFWEIALKLGDE